MGFTQKDWISEVDHAGPPASPPGTPISGASLEDLETRVTDYSDLLAGTTAGIYNVLDYGAVANGSDDDTAEIQAAIDAAPAGSTVFVPPADTGQYYKISSTLTISKSLIFRGGGKLSEIRQTGNDTVLTVTGTDVAVRDLAISGNPSGSGIWNNKCGVLLSGATNVEVSGCYFSQIRLYGLALASGTARCHVHDNTFATAYVANTETNAVDIYSHIGAQVDNRITRNRCISTNKNAGIMLTVDTAAASLERNQITDNYVTGTIRNPSNTGGQGIQLYGGYSGELTVRNNVISRNTLNATQGAGIYLNSGTANPTFYNTIVADNQLYGCNTLGSGGVLNDAVIAVDHSPGTQVRGNQIYGGGDGTYVVAIGLNLGSDDCIIAHNHASSLADIDGGGIGVLNNAVTCSRVHIEGNTIGGTSNTQIFLPRGSGHIVKGNILTNGGYRGIEFGANVSDSAAIGNTVVSSTSHAFAADTGATRCRFLNNKAITCTLFRNDNGTNTEWRGNHQSTGAIQGRAVLVGGTVTVNTAEALTGDNIRLTNVANGGTVGTPYVSAIVNATSFTITSTSGSDTSTIFWEIVH